MRSKSRSSGRELPPGLLLHGRYQIIRMLGEGGFGITYEAWDRKEDCRVALKEYMPAGLTARDRSTGAVIATRDEAHYRKYLERFISEAQIVYAYRKHPNIVEVRHLFRDNQTAYYAMEYLEGSDLRKLLLSSGRISWEYARPIFAQVCSALYAVHQSGIVHCDISPDNILLLNGGLAKVIDFGAAKSQIGGNSSMVILKQGFAPPEQYGGNGRLGPWTDIYALAVTIYCCITGSMPPKSIDRLVTDRIIPPTALAPLPADFPEAALLRALEPRIERRFQSIDSFWSAMTAARVHSWYLEGLHGVWAGRLMQLGSITFAGTDMSCQVRFPGYLHGIGRRHFRLWLDRRKLFLTDLGSGYPSWLENIHLTPGLIYEVKSGCQIRIGEREVFRVTLR